MNSRDRDREERTTAPNTAPRMFTSPASTTVSPELYKKGRTAYVVRTIRII
jgi:hypothetical protein